MKYFQLIQMTKFSRTNPNNLQNLIQYSYINVQHSPTLLSSSSGEAGRADGPGAWLWLETVSSQYQLTAVRGQCAAEQQYSDINRYNTVYTDTVDSTVHTLHLCQHQQRDSDSTLSP